MKTELFAPCSSIRLAWRSCRTWRSFLQQPTESPPSAGVLCSGVSKQSLNNPMAIRIGEGGKKPSPSSKIFCRAFVTRSQNSNIFCSRRSSDRCPGQITVWIFAFCWFAVTYYSCTILHPIPIWVSKMTGCIFACPRIFKIKSDFLLRAPLTFGELIIETDFVCPNVWGV